MATFSAPNSTAASSTLRMMAALGLAAVLIVDGGCKSTNDGGQVLTLPEGMITKERFTLYVRGLIREPDPLALCNFLLTLDDQRLVESTRLPPEATPVSSTTPPAGDIVQAAAIVRDECDALARELGVDK